MPASAEHARRSLGYPIAGLVIAAMLLVLVGPHVAKAMTRSSASSSPAASSSPSASPSPVPVAATAPTAQATTIAGPYRVVGLGDSVPAGNVCGCTSYVSQVGKQEAAEHGTSADVSNLAVGGYQTSDVLDQLTDKSVQRKLTDADLVIITIGANDFATGEVGDQDCRGPALDCFRSTLHRQASQLDALFTKVDALVGEQTTVLVTGYWNVFLDGDVAATRGADYVRNSVALTRAENSQIAAEARAEGATYADIFTPFKGDAGTRDDTALLASDGDHPNAAGHRLIAKTLESVLDAG